jgi:HD superfamily phosphohydrolase
MKTVRVIKEPIHDYIGVSELEHALINDPLFLRLQHISQNGLAYLTYPNNRTSRFIHSLGTMHIGGEMTVGVINSADRDLRLSFLESFRDVMNDAAQNVSMTIGQLQSFISSRKDVFYNHNGLDPEDPSDATAITLFQSMRIACVMHDLGHPPFSHSTEMVLQSKFNSYTSAKSTPLYKEFVDILTNLRRAEQGQLHERIGTELVLYVFSNVGGDLANYGKFCFWIANRILTPERAKDDPKAILKCLHSIVSGESVDADRCDYVLRDGYASSFEFGDYDLTRILHNLRLRLNTSGEFEIASTTTAASALESFFLERYRIWRWVVFHPNVVRAEVALSRALNILLEIAFADSHTTSAEVLVRRILDSLRFSRLWRPFGSAEKYREYVSCDEAWLLSLFRTIQEALSPTEWLPRRVAILKACLDFVLDRKKSQSSFTTLWKRAEEYEDFAASVRKLSNRHEKKLKLINLPQGKPSVVWLNHLIGKVLAKDLSAGEVECLRSLEDRLQTRLKAMGFDGALLTRVLKFSPYKECFLMDKTGKILALSSLSSVTDALQPTWDKDIQFRCYWITLKKDGDRVAKDDSGPTPTRDDLARCFLEALLDEPHWASLEALLSAKGRTHGKNR